MVNKYKRTAGLPCREIFDQLIPHMCLAGAYEGPQEFLECTGAFADDNHAERAHLLSLSRMLLEIETYKYNYK